MRCINCSNVINSVDNLLIDFNPEDYGLYINESDSPYKCSSCDDYILYGDYYFEDDEIDDIEEDLCYSISEVIGKSIDSCHNCGHGNEMSDLQAGLYVNFKENDEWEELYDNYNVCTELQDLICENCLIDEKYYDLIIDNIRCPNCGNGGGAYSKDTMYDEKFNKYSEVYTKKDVEMFDERFYGVYPSIKNYVKFINEEIPVDELERFRENYIKNQAFINEDKVFKILYLKLEEIFNNKKYILLYQSKRLFRTRLNEAGCDLYEKDLMWNPPDGLPEQGRYNCHGKSILYCSNNINILKKEIVAKSNQEYNFAIFRLLRTMKMLPVNLIFDDFEGFINDDSVENANLKKKYIITNIIQMICEKIGYNGVAYQSVKDGRYVNYGFFNFHKNEDIEIIKVFK